MSPRTPPRADKPGPTLSFSEEYRRWFRETNFDEDDQIYAVLYMLGEPDSSNHKGQQPHLVWNYKDLRAAVKLQADHAAAMCDCRDNPEHTPEDERRAESRSAILAELLKSFDVVVEYLVHKGFIIYLPG